VSQKNYTFIHNFDKYWADFQNSFTVVFYKKFATKSMPHCPAQLRCVAPLPCER